LGSKRKEKTGRRVRTQYTPLEKCGRESKGSRFKGYARMSVRGASQDRGGAPQITDRKEAASVSHKAGHPSTGPKGTLEQVKFRNNDLNAAQIAPGLL